jgi:hypothetical protein
MWGVSGTLGTKGYENTFIIVVLILFFFLSVHVTNGDPLSAFQCNLMLKGFIKICRRLRVLLKIEQK